MVMSRKKFLGGVRVYSEEEAEERRILIALKRKAIRRGAWFRVLSGIERGVMDLVIRLVHTVHNRMLASTLARILVKLYRATNYANTLEEIGKPIAEKISEYYARLGNKEAAMWKYDRAYARCLGLNQMNNPLFARLPR